MRLHFLLLGFFAGLEVLALDAASPWEMMYLYAAYKAEWLAGLNGSQRQIATLCKRSITHPFPGSDFDTQAAAAGVTKMCSFDDFVKFVGTQRTFANYHYSLVGNLWEVDKSWQEISDKFVTSRMKGGSDSRYAYNLQNLLSKGGFGGGKNAFPAAISQIANALQTAREAAPEIDAVKSQVDHALEYSRIAQQIRLRDSVGFAVVTVKRYLALLGPSNPFTLQYKTQVLIAPPAPVPKGAGNIGNYNNELDFDKTLMFTSEGEMNSAAGPDRNAFKAYFANEYADLAATKDHNNVIQAFKQVADFIKTNEAGCRLG